MTLPHDVARCPGRITHRPLGSIADVRVTSNAGHSECVRCRMEREARRGAKKNGGHHAS